MNTKVLVEIYVPDLDITYNVFIPASRKVANVIIDLVKGLAELSDGAYPIGNNHALMNGNTCEIYKNDLNIKDAGIKNGAKLLLV